MVRQPARVSIAVPFLAAIAWALPGCRPPAPEEARIGMVANAAVPVAQDDFIQILEDQAVEIGVLSNDTIDDGLATLTVEDPPSGTASWDGIHVDYVPDPDFVGQDSFQYTVEDLDGETATATVTVDVLPQNDLPVAVPDSFGVFEDATDVQLPVAANDQFADGFFGVFVRRNPLHGTAFSDEFDLYYTPAPDFAGTDSLEYDLCDQDFECTFATVTITVTNTDDPVAAQPDGVHLASGSSARLLVLRNDRGADGGLSVTVETPPATGTALANANGTIDYIADPVFTGTETFTYTTTDADGDTAVATVTAFVSAGFSSSAGPASQSIDEGTVATFGGAVRLPAAPTEAAWDFDGDSVDDLVLCDADGGTPAPDCAGLARRRIFGGEEVYLSGASSELLERDLDADGDRDLLAGGSAATLVGDGNGGLSRPLSIGLDRVRRLDVGDVNGDGIDDLVAATAPAPNGVDDNGDSQIDEPGEDPPSEVVVLAGDGTGGFPAEHARVYVGSGAATDGEVADIAVRDLDGDSDADVLVTQISLGGSGELRLLRSTPSGLSPEVVATTAFAFIGVEVADVNGDSFPDLRVIETLGGLSDYVNDGTGTFVEGGSTSLSIVGGGFVEEADLQGDSVPETVVFSIDPGTFEGTSGPALDPQFEILGGSVFEGGGRPGIGDLDGDGIPEIAVHTDDPSELLVYDLPATEPLRYAIPEGIDAAAIADLDGDGLLDVAVAGGGLVHVLRGSGTGDVGASFRAGEGGLGGAAADFTGDGVLDVASSDDGKLFLLEGDARGGFLPRREIEPLAIGVVVGALAAGDLDADGDVDVVSVGGETGTGRVYLNDGTGELTGASFGGSFSTAERVVAADVTGDGAAEVVFHDPDSDGLYRLANDGAGNLAEDGFAALFGEPLHDLIAADVTADGIPDFIWSTRQDVSGGATEDRIEIAADSSLFFPFIEYPLGPADLTAQAGALAAGDVNGDGETDLVVGQSGGVDVLAGNGAGALTGPAFVPIAGLATGEIDLADLDGDGALDLVVATPSDLVVSGGDGNGVFGAASVSAMPVGGAGEVFAGDLDGDGRLDVTSIGFLHVATWHNTGSRWFLDAAASSLPFDESGNFVARLSVTAGGQTHEETFDIEVRESEPAVAGHGFLSPPEERATATVTASLSAPLADAVVSCSWDFGDGTPAVAVPACAGFAGTDLPITAEHVYADGDPTDYDVTLSVVDEDGMTTDVIVQSIANMAPGLSSPTTSLLEGVASPFTVEIDDSPDESWAAAWDVTGGGTFADVSAAPTVVREFTVADQGTFSVQVTVTDQTDGAGSPSPGSAAATQAFSVPVLDHVPAIGVIGASEPAVAEGQVVTYSATVVAVADDPIASCAWDWGDGSAPEEDPACMGSPTSAAVSRTHVYADGDPTDYTITLTVADEDGSVTATRVQTVENAAPSVTVDSIIPEPSDEGSTATVEVTVDDPAGSLDGSLRLTWDWGDGASDTTVVGVPGTYSRAHAWRDQGAFAVSVEVADQTDLVGNASPGTATGSDGATHDVSNVAPTLVPLGGPYAAVEGQVLLRQASAADAAGPDDPLVFSLASGPGGVTVAPSGAIAWAPTYSQSGPPSAPAPHTVTIAVSDGDGGADSGSFVVLVAWRDDDADGMADTWELSNGLDATRDDSQEDTDGDGVLNVDEFNADTPAGARHPGPVTVVSPLDGTRIADEDPAFTLGNAEDLDGGPLTYQVQVARDLEFTDVVVLASGAEGAVQTVVAVDDVLTDAMADGDDPANPNDAELDDDTVYRWRARAVDPGGLAGPWSATRSFFYDPVNDAPSAPAAIAPTPGEQVGSLTPALVAAAATDPDHAATELTYEFRVHDEPTATDPPIASSGVVSPAGSPVVTWTVTPALVDGAEYWWTVRAVDPLGAEAVAGPFAFRPNLGNDEPGIPSIVSPADGADVAGPGVTLTAGVATDGDGDALTYRFELLSPSMSVLESSGWIPEGGAGQTQWSPSVTLLENGTYHWRVRASDGLATGEGALASFRVNGVDEAPTAPVFVNPADGQTVSDRLASVTFANGVDPEGGALSWRLRVYEGDAPGTPAEALVDLPGTVVSGAALTTTPVTLDARGTFTLVLVHEDAGGAASAQATAVVHVRKAGGGGGGGGGGCSVAAGVETGAAGALLAMVAALAGTAGARRRRERT